MRLVITDRHPNGESSDLVIAGELSDGSPMSVESMKMILSASFTALGSGDDEIEFVSQETRPSVEETIKELLKSGWEDIKNSVTSKGCTLCGGPHIAFNCPKKHIVYKAKNRIHAPNMCVGPSGVCPVCKVGPGVECKS